MNYSIANEMQPDAGYAYGKMLTTGAFTLAKLTRLGFAYLLTEAPKDALLEEAQNLDLGKSIKRKVEGYSYIIGKKENGTAFFIPYSISWKKRWFLRGATAPRIIGNGSYKEAIEATEYTKSGQRQVVILKNKGKDEATKEQFLRSCSVYDDLHKEGELPFVEKKGIVPECRRGVRIVERYDGDLYNSKKIFSAEKITSITHQLICGIQDVTTKGYYPMDFKPLNVLEKEGNVVISDLDDSHKLPETKEEYVFHTPYFNSPSITTAHKVKPAERGDRLKKELAYQIAITFVLLTNRNILEDTYLFTRIEHNAEFEEYYTQFNEWSADTLRAQLTNYAEEQREIIIQALSNSPTHRPSLEKMEGAFTPYC